MNGTGRTEELDIFGDRTNLNGRESCNITNKQASMISVVDQMLAFAFSMAYCLWHSIDQSINHSVK
jgi:hypothetical protein